MHSSASSPNAGKALIYHFSHLDNLPAIFAAGALVCDADAQKAGLRTAVGDPGIKERRRHRRIPHPPHGTVADYVPFYFAPRSPMMYRIACDHRDQIPGRYLGGDDPLVYLVSSVDRIVEAGLRWAATDGNCATPVSQFVRSLADLTRLVDWPLMSAERWHNTPEDPDRLRRRMAEFLVHRAVPLSVLAGFAVRTESRAREVRDLLAAHDLSQHYVGVKENWYYGYDVGGGHA